MFGSRLRAIWTTLLVVSLLACVACEKKPHDLAFHVSFVCPEDHAATDTLTLHVIKGGCDGSEWVYEASLGPDEVAPAGKGIGPGTYGFEAIASTEGNEVASGCVESSLPASEAPMIALRSDSCTEPPGEDAGEDASETEDAEGPDMDADTLDAESDAQLDAEADAEIDASTGDASTGDGGMSADADAASGDGESPDAAPIPCATDCKDSFPCTEDRCVNGECVHEPYTGTRECDGIACTVNDRCESGNCRAGTPNPGACPDDGNPCTAETCEVGSGCSRQNASNTTSCNDNIGCTNPDRCNNGICRGTDTCTNNAVCSAASGMCIMCTSPNDCNDGDPCTDDSCSGGKCTNTRVAGRMNVCSDGKSCTNNDACTATANPGCQGTSTCPNDATCGGSNCRCNDSNETYCSGTNTCTTMADDAANCGQCGRGCGEGGTCERSACKPSDAANCSAWRYNGHEYLICPAVNGGGNSSTWAWARDKCKSWGLGLAIIDDADENTFLSTNDGDVDHWMAANDRGDNGNCRNFLGCDKDSQECTQNAQEGQWYWASNADDNFRKFCTCSRHGSCTAEPNAYSNFKANEPNNDSCNCPGSFGGSNCSEGEDCGVIYADGTWNDARCNSVLGFICETP